MIVQFKPRDLERRNRVKDLVKGAIEYYICNNCNEEFEVAYKEFPQYCPHCKAYIDWGNSEK